MYIVYSKTTSEVWGLFSSYDSANNFINSKVINNLKYIIGIMERDLYQEIHDDNVTESKYLTSSIKDIEYRLNDYDNYSNVSNWMPEKYKPYLISYEKYEFDDGLHNHIILL